MSTGEAGQRWVRPSRQARRVTPCLKAARSQAWAPLPLATSLRPPLEPSTSPPHTHTPFKQRPSLYPMGKGLGWKPLLASPSELLGTCCNWARRQGKGKGGRGTAATFRGVRQGRLVGGGGFWAEDVSAASNPFLVEVAPTTSFSPHSYSLSYGPGKRERHAKRVWPWCQPHVPSPE